MNCAKTGRHNNLMSFRCQLCQAIKAVLARQDDREKKEHCLTMDEQPPWMGTKTKRNNPERANKQGQLWLKDGGNETGAVFSFQGEHRMT